ncbi:MAG: thiamine diphosphokinase [Clostridia bacterium]|nr:thiamine diphosphokinase [Clostridia bacterium]
MGICYIVGAGDCKVIDFKENTDDLVIAADGGYKYLLYANKKADIVVGDFDSLGEIPQNENIIKLNPVKDITDMQAAVDIGIEKGYKEFVLYGALGGRFDHSLANLQLIASLSQNGKKALVRDGETVITAVTNGRIEFDASHKGYISVFAHSDICSGVNEKGLKYTLVNAELKNTFPLGVSNEFIGIKSEISVVNGTVMVVYSV